GVFCTLHKRGQLRGCIGTTEPTRRNIAEEIIFNAIAAAVRDPRFEPVAPHELDDIVYSVDVLSPPEPVSGPEELDPQRYGVIVRNGGRVGLLLPNLEGINTVEEQISIARRKAGIGLNAPVELERFEVTRYE
ncbi:MAG: AmmeMemoRadiSam system protein A, partial [Bacillota bacterium]